MGDEKLLAAAQGASSKIKIFLHVLTRISGKDLTQDATSVMPACRALFNVKSEVVAQTRPCPGRDHGDTASVSDELTLNPKP